MSAFSLLTAIGGVLSTISSIKGVYLHAPASVSTANMPCAVVLHSGTRVTQHAAGMRRYEHTFTVIVAVSPVSQDLPSSRHSQAIQIHDTVVSALSADFSLGGLSDHIAEIRSDGMGVVSIAGVEHVGYEIRITVVEKGA